MRASHRCPVRTSFSKAVSTVRTRVQADTSPAPEKGARRCVAHRARAPIYTRPSALLMSYGGTADHARMPPIVSAKRGPSPRPGPSQSAGGGRGQRAQQGWLEWRARAYRSTCATACLSSRASLSSPAFFWGVCARLGRVEEGKPTSHWHPLIRQPVTVTRLNVLTLLVQADWVKNRGQTV